MSSKCPGYSPVPALGRKAGAFGWVFPATMLVLMPKCPVCFAGYVLVFSGISLPFSTAAVLRHSLIALCLISLAFLLVRCLRVRSFR